MLLPIIPAYKCLAPNLAATVGRSVRLWDGLSAGTVGAPIGSVPSLWAFLARAKFASAASHHQGGALSNRCCGILPSSAEQEWVGIWSLGSMGIEGNVKRSPSDM